jgi:hypothetical protein
VPPALPCPAVPAEPAAPVLPPPPEPPTALPPRPPPSDVMLENTESLPFVFTGLPPAPLPVPPAPTVTVKFVPVEQDKVLVR